MSRIQRVNMVFCATVLISVGSSFIPLSEFTSNDTIRLLLSQFILVLPAIVYIIKSKQKYSEIIRFRKMKAGNIVLTIVLTFLVMPVMTLVNAISMLFTVNTTVGTMSQITGNTSFLISFITIALIPSIFEESVYRGVFYNEYRKVRPLAGIILSAFLFGILHGNFNQFSYAFFMGIVFALVIEATDSILSTMIIHFIINFNSVAILSFYPKFIDYLSSVYHTAKEAGNESLMNFISGFVGTEEISMDGISQAAQTLDSETLGSIIRLYGMPALICSILAFLVYRVIAKNTGRWELIKNIFQRTSNQEPDSQLIGTKADTRLITIPLLASIMFCLFMMIVNELLIRNILS